MYTWVRLNYCWKETAAAWGELERLYRLEFHNIVEALRVESGINLQHTVQGYEEQRLSGRLYYGDELIVVDTHISLNIYIFAWESFREQADGMGFICFCRDKLHSHEKELYDLPIDKLALPIFFKLSGLSRRDNSWLEFRSDPCFWRNSGDNQHLVNVALAFLSRHLASFRFGR